MTQPHWIGFSKPQSAGQSCQSMPAFAARSAAIGRAARLAVLPVPWPCRESALADGRRDGAGYQGRRDEQLRPNRALPPVSSVSCPSSGTSPYIVCDWYGDPFCCEVPENRA